MLIHCIVIVGTNIYFTPLGACWKCCCNSVTFKRRWGEASPPLLFPSSGAERGVHKDYIPPPNSFGAWYWQELILSLSPMKATLFSTSIWFYHYQVLKKRWGIRKMLLKLESPHSTTLNHCYHHHKKGKGESCFPYFCKPYLNHNSVSNRILKENKAFFSH